MEWTEDIATDDRSFPRSGLFQRPVAGHREKRVDRRVDAVDPVQEVPDHLNRRDLPARYTFSDPGDRCPCQAFVESHATSLFRHISHG
jgi:hypothetical protein